MGYVDMPHQIVQGGEGCAAALPLACEVLRPFHWRIGCSRFLEYTCSLRGWDEDAVLVSLLVHWVIPRGDGEKVGLRRAAVVGVVSRLDTRHLPYSIVIPHLLSGIHASGVETVLIHSAALELELSIKNESVGSTAIHDRVLTHRVVHKP